MARVIINKDGNINCIFGLIGVCSRLPRMALHQERQRMAQELMIVMIMTYGAIALCGIAILLWFRTKSGKKWLSDL